jgi:hypothetical protein
MYVYTYIDICMYYVQTRLNRRAYNSQPLIQQMRVMHLAYTRIYICTHTHTHKYNLGIFQGEDPADNGDVLGLKDAYTHAHIHTHTHTHTNTHPGIFHGEDPADNGDEPGAFPFAATCACSFSRSSRREAVPERV